MGDAWIQVTEVFQETHNLLLVGVIILVGYLGGKLAGRVRLPSVVGYLLVGVIFGPSILKIIPDDTAKELGLLTDLGLGLIGFMIGTEISRELIKKMGVKLGAIILCQSAAAFLCVMVAVRLLGDFMFPVGLSVVAAALIFAAMAPATAPAGTVAVVQECRAKGPFTSLLLALVGLDDGTSIMIYVFAAAVAKVLLGANGVSFGALIGGPAIEILGAIALGAVVGAGLTAVVSRTRSRLEVLTLTVGAILLTTGLANAMHLSLILANLSVGVVVVNLSTREAGRAYDAVGQITHPIFIMFFVIAGAHLNFWLLSKIGLIVPVYIVCRTIGKIGGAYIGAAWSKADGVVRHWLGLGTLSQAGVAIGLALLAMKEFSEFGDAGRQLGVLLINTIAVTTIFFEILGPITTKIALVRAGEVGNAEAV